MQKQMVTHALLVLGRGGWDKKNLPTFQYKGEWNWTTDSDDDSQLPNADVNYTYFQLLQAKLLSEIIYD